MMDDAAIFGEVHDSCDDVKKRASTPKTPIGKFYEARKHEIITHWCKKCRRWHASACFYEMPPKLEDKS